MSDSDSDDDPWSAYANPEVEHIIYHSVIDFKPNFDDGNDFTDIDFTDNYSVREALPHLFPDTISAPEVRHQVSERREQVLSSYASLSDLLVRHEATIHRRWGKKSKAARIKLLLEAWPKMPKPHRPDFWAYREEDKDRDCDSFKTRFRDYYLWPYINQDDLSGRALLLFLNARGRNHPSHFAHADFEAAHLGILSHSVHPEVLHDYTMILSGVEDSRYAELVHWDSLPDSFELMLDKKQFLVGEGLLVLEIQERVLRFLVGCCQILLHDIPLGDLVNNVKYPPQPPPALRAAVDADGFRSQAVMAEEEPYRVPAQLDLEGMVSLLAAEVDAQVDHHWLLREDPSYFLEEVAEIIDHRQEKIKDTQGGTHPLLSLNRHAEFSQLVVANLLDDAYLDMLVFTDLAQQASAVQVLHDHHAPLDPVADLPTPLFKGMLYLRHHLEAAATRLRRKLWEALPPSPPMRRFYARVTPTRPTDKIHIVSRNVSMDDQEKNLNWLCKKLWDNEQLEAFRLPLLMDEMDRQLRESSEHLSPRVAAYFGRLSVLTQCLRQLDQFYPWSASFKNGPGIEAKPALTKTSDAWYARISKVMRGLDERADPLVRLMDNPKATFHYPSHRRPTRENTEVLRRAEGNLDKFWHTVDSAMASAGANEPNMPFPMVARRTIGRRRGSSLR